MSRRPLWRLGRRHRGYERGLGLRARVTVVFAFGAAALSATLAGATFGLVHHYLLSQRQTSAIRQSYANARLVRQELGAGGVDVADVLSALAPGTSTRSLVYRGGRWFSTSVSVAHGVLPASLTSVVLGGAPAYQRVEIDGQPSLAVGIPLPAVGGDYFEVHQLSELQTTLDTVAAVLVLVAVVMALGGAAVGRWASGRLVQPLRDVAGVAEAITAGSLDQRIAGGRDPDLEPLVRSFNEMVAALQGRIDREQRFTSDVSHELRSPLTAVETSAEVLSMFRSCLPPEGEKALDLLQLETGRFSQMVEDLLEIARMDAGAAQLRMERLSVLELVEFAAGVYGRGPLPVRVSASAAYAQVLADKRRMLRVLSNLIDNAERHAGGALAIVADRVDDSIEISVEDAGPGVPVEDRGLVFERFYRGGGEASLRGRGGSGLGLSLVAEHVRAHAGTVTVTDRDGGGARFTVRLPMDPS